MLAMVERMGRYWIHKLQHLGAASIFLYSIIVRRPFFKRLIPLSIREIYNLGVLSLFIMIISALFIGFVVSLQGFNTLEKFGSSAQLGQLVSLSIVRELGPVLSALLFVGRAGSSLTAEIGLMNATDQISSMAMIGVDPRWRVVLPRLIAGIISLPILTVIFDVVAIYGGYLVGVKWLGVDNGIFWNNMQSSVDFRVDIFSGIVKSVVFAIVVTWISVYQGYHAQRTSEGVSIATTKTVVYSSLAILILDFILTAIMIGGW